MQVQARQIWFRWLQEETSVSPSIDLEAYCARIGYMEERKPTVAVLEKMHLAHATHIPFENLDIFLGKPIRLDLNSLQAKLVRAQRGGYCFEQNTLFAAALEQIGFQVTRLAARVRLGATHLLPRTHMLLRVETEGVPWLADVGFGGEGLLQPLPMVEGKENRQFSWSYRLIQEGELWVLQSLHEGSWQDLYAFTLERQYEVDFELANYWTSTHPASVFVKTLTVQRPTPEGRYALRGRQFTIMRGEASSMRTIEDEGSLLKVLEEVFGLSFPPGTQFHAPVADDSNWQR
jgi:N-hydroxyarylamine O-acetyltransferase